MSDSAKTKKDKSIEESLVRFSVFLFKVFLILREGVKLINWKCPVTIVVIILFNSIAFFVLGSYKCHLYFMNWVFPQYFTPFWVNKFSSLGPLPNGIFLMSSYWFLGLFICGSRPYRERQGLKESLERLNIKAGASCTPKLLHYQKEGQYKIRMTILSKGIGVSAYESKIEEIKSSFNMFVDSIKEGSEPQFVIISLTTRIIPSLCHFKNLENKITRPYSFIVGEALSGIVTKSITDIPGGHIIVGGTTGGGKSNWFKATLLSLLKTSPHSEFFLLDFKGGVEFMPFLKFPNVSVEKDIKGALRRLRQVQAEMNWRFDKMVEKGRPNVVPKRDHMNHLFVAVDEASLLYGKVQKSDPNFNNVIEARSITNDIAKRGRAACISLILATQKVTKETIDTSIQENVTGRMCFRMNTFEGSNRMLGSKDAMELPETLGRAIWQCGNTQIEVQAPLLDEKDIELAAQEAEYLHKEEKKSKFFRLLSNENMKNEVGNNSYLKSREEQGQMVA